jgi:hypothetical protein
MRLLIRNVNHDSFPGYPTARNLPELLSSVGTQPLRCAAVSPGHVALAVANGSYLHVLSAKPGGGGGGGTSAGAGTPPGGGGITSDGASSSSSQIENLRAAFGSTLSNLGGLGGSDGGDSHLSFHGASPVAALAFVPADRASGAPLCLLAVQEDGAVAAWRWGCWMGRESVVSLGWDNLDNLILHLCCFFPQPSSPASTNEAARTEPRPRVYACILSREESPCV